MANKSKSVPDGRGVDGSPILSNTPMLIRGGGELSAETAGTRGTGVASPGLSRLARSTEFWFVNHREAVASLRMASGEPWERQHVFDSLP